MAESCICTPVGWAPDCPEHGIGTEYFRDIIPKPAGYAGERDTTREQWLEFRRIQASVRRVA